MPDEYGIVARPDYVKVRAQDRHGEWFEVEGHGLTARAFCHELDHLDGILFIDKATRMLAPESSTFGSSFCSGVVQYAAR